MAKKKADEKDVCVTLAEVPEATLREVQDQEKTVLLARRLQQTPLPVSYCASQ